MIYLNSLILALQALVTAGAGVRAVMCIIRITADDEQASSYKRRLKNLLIFTVVSVSVLQLLKMIYSYYLGGAT